MYLLNNVLPETKLRYLQQRNDSTYFLLSSFTTVESWFAPPCLDEYVCGERLFDRVDFSEFHKHDLYVHCRLPSNNITSVLPLFRESAQHITIKAIKAHVITKIAVGNLASLFAFFRAVLCCLSFHQLKVFYDPTRVIITKQYEQYSSFDYYNGMITLTAHWTCWRSVTHA